ncbi:Nuclear pore complex protein NUP107 [Linum grandiflorum]
MDVEMETSPAYYRPEDLTIREQFRRYGKRHSVSSSSPGQEGTSSKFKDSRLLYDGESIHSPTNAVLLLEHIKQEADGMETDHFDAAPARVQASAKRRSAIEGFSEADLLVDPELQTGSQSLKACKIEDESADSGEAVFGLFASLLDSAIQGLMPIPDLILRFERLCRNVSEDIRSQSNIRHRVLEDKLMRQKVQLLLDEAATWSLLWHLYGKVTEEHPEELIVSPPTSHVEACQFVASDHTAQLCLRIVQWLEGLASKSLDLESKANLHLQVQEPRVGTYLPNSGIWHSTQRLLKTGKSGKKTIHHLDFDAPTREHAHQLPDDQKQEESLLEDVWTLLRAGRLEEACDLCRSAGQSWRAATLSPFGGLTLVPSIEALLKNGRSRTLQAIELESGIGHQLRLWKWAAYSASEKIAEQNGGKFEAGVYAAQCSNLKRMLPVCTDWESACWAMAKSWLDVQVDLELAGLQPGRLEQLKSYGDNTEGSPVQSDNGSQGSGGPDSWPLQVKNQQPRNLSALLQKLHSGEMVNEAVIRGCKEQQRQIQMNMMLGNIPHLLDVMWSWIAPSEDDENVFRPHGDPQLIRFGAHLVLVLRYLLAEEMKDSFREKLMNAGDLILHLYAMFLFSKQHEELVGIYASQLARHRCIDLFVHMMELRLTSSVHVKYKLFLSAMEYLPFSPEDDSKGSFEEIIERVLSRSREIKVGKYDKSAEVAEQHRLQSLQKATVIQWLCFTPPSTITNVKDISGKLLMRALVHSNMLFREFALISMWRVPAMPIGAHALLSLLAEPLKRLSELPAGFEDYISENLKEFQDWSEYYSCDATYRKWLKVELANAEVPPTGLFVEEKQRAVTAAREALDCSLSLLLRNENPWLTSMDDPVYESESPVYLELHATAMLCLPSGECMLPDATVCTALMSALYSSVGEEVVLHRQLMVKVAISTRDNYCIEVIVRCLAVEGDGLGSHQAYDGGVLATVIAAGFKAWSYNGNIQIRCLVFDRKWVPRKPCTIHRAGPLPQVSVSLMESGNALESHDELIELVSSTETGFLHLFSQQQLQKVFRNYDPALRPQEKATEYVRALNAAKLEKIFAKPFVGALDGHIDAVSCMAKNPNYLKGFFSGSMDGDIRLWDLASGRTICQFPGHQGAVKGLTVSTDGSTLISCGTDCTVRLWSVPVASIMGSNDASNKSVEENAAYVGKNAYLAVDHQWGSDLFATTGARVEIWNHNRSQPVNTFEWGTATVISARFNPGEPNMLATSASDRSIALYDLRMSTPVGKVIMQTRTNSIAWNPMEPLNFTAANEDCNCYSFDSRKLDIAKCVHKDHVSSVLDIDYSPTGREFVTGSYDRTVRIFPYNGGHSREIYHTKRMQRVFCVKFSCDASYVISGSDDTNLRVWKANASEQLGVLTPRERRSHEYQKAVLNRYKEFEDIKRIVRHRHKPKSVLKAMELHRTVRDAEKQKRDRRKAHSAPGSIVTKPLRQAKIIKQVE